MWIVVIDPGHSGPIEPGACNRNNGLRECDVVLKAAFVLEQELTRRGFLCILTRSGDTLDDGLTWRAEIANVNNADLFVSLHCNAANSTQANGHEVWTCPGQTESDKAAEKMFLRVSEAFPDMYGRADYGDGDPDKEAKFTVLTATNMAAVLYELAFISNDDEAALLDDPVFINKYMDALAQGISDYFGER